MPDTLTPDALRTLLHRVQDTIMDCSTSTAADATARLALFRQIEGALQELQERRLAALPPPTGPVPSDNHTSVDSGALMMVLNILRRAGKNEAADALESTAVRGSNSSPPPIGSVPSEAAKRAAIEARNRRIMLHNGGDALENMGAALTAAYAIDHAALIAERDELVAEVGMLKADCDKFKDQVHWTNRRAVIAEERAGTAERERDELRARLDAVQSTPPPPVEYRMLEEGELIEEGDEYLSDKWRPTAAARERVAAHNVGHYRRPIRNTAAATGGEVGE